MGTLLSISPDSPLYIPQGIQVYPSAVQLLHSPEVQSCDPPEHTVSIIPFVWSSSTSEIVSVNLHSMGIKPYVCDQLYPSPFYDNVMIPCKFRTAHPRSFSRHMSTKHGFVYPQRRFPKKSKNVENITKSKCKVNEDPTSVLFGANDLSPYFPTGSIPDTLFPAFPLCSGSTGSGTTGSGSLSSAISLDSDPAHHTSISDRIEMDPSSNDFEVPPTTANSMLDTSHSLASGQEDALDFVAAFPSYSTASSSSPSYSFPGDNLFNDAFTTSTGSGLTNQMNLTTTQFVPLGVTSTGSQQEFGSLVSSQDMKYSVPQFFPADISTGGSGVEPDYFSLSTPQLPSNSQGVMGLDAASLYTSSNQDNLGLPDIRCYDFGSYYPSMDMNITF